MPADRFIDVWLKDTLTDPIAQTKPIYEFVGMQFTAEASSYMAEWKAENRRDKRVARNDALQLFGLSEAATRTDFANYRERFVVNT